MSCIGKCVVKWGLLTGVALGGAAVLFPDHVAAGLYQVKSTAQDIADQVVDDPVALRRQLEKLGDEYPDRIAAVQGEIAQVNHELSLVAEEADTAQRVVAITTQDLSELQGLIAKAEARQQEVAGIRTVAVRFDGARFDIDGAYEEARRINGVRLSYEDRLALAEQQATFLNEQKTRLHEILANLTTEFETFQSQMWQLDRQIEAVKRNERLIEMVKEQESTLASYDKFGKVGNLGQLQSKLKQLQVEQQARLEALSKTRMSITKDYEARAKLEKHLENQGDDPFRDLIIEEDDADEDDEEAARPIAFLETEVISN